MLKGRVGGYCLKNSKKVSMINNQIPRVSCGWFPSIFMLLLYVSVIQFINIYFILM